MTADWKANLESRAADAARIPQVDAMTQQERLRHARAQVQRVQAEHVTYEREKRESLLSSWIGAAMAVVYTLATLAMILKEWR